MRSLVVALSFGIAVTGCSAGDQKVAPEALKATVKPCFSTIRSVPLLIEIAGTGAVNASYAAEAKAIATACIEARKHLQKMDSASPCGPLIGELEALGWKLNAAFEGREKLPPPEALLTYMGSDSPLAAACLEAQGIRPEPTTAASRDADKAGDDAEAAAREADKAASDANAAMKKATQ